MRAVIRPLVRCLEATRPRNVRNKVDDICSLCFLASMKTLHQLITSVRPRRAEMQHVLIEYIGRTERSVSDEFRLTLHTRFPLEGFDPISRTNSQPHQLFQGIIPVVARSLQREVDRQWTDERVRLVLDYHYDWLPKVAAGTVQSLTLKTYSPKHVEELTVQHCLSYFMRVTQ